jgi:murein DD-endopeptidase MepM/ murein hydrolase activator NlpD
MVRGTEVLASHGGTIVFQGSDSNGAYYIDILNGTGEVKTRYLHLSKFAMSSPVGTTISQGQLIGYSGGD